MSDPEAQSKAKKTGLTGSDETSDLTETVVEAISDEKASFVLPAAGITLGELRRTYNTIIKSQAIYYPVAYRLVEELGRGHQGIVFLSMRQGARGCITQHAIKLFDPVIYRSAEEYWTDMGRIASQISQLQGLQSPNLVSRHSYDETYGIGYVEMDAIDGIDIRQFLNGKHVDIVKSRCTEEEWKRFSRTIVRQDGDIVAFQPGAVVYVLRRVLRGLDVLHTMNFLHCDVKPGNIMIDRLGSVRIVDFGRAVVAGERLTFLLGAPMYMAPETHRHEPIDFQADLYSVGLIGLEMLRGRPLTDAAEMDHDKLLQAKMALSSELPRLLPLNVKRNKNLVQTISRLVDPDPRKRYATVKDAEVGDGSLRIVDKQFARSRQAVEYDREFADYLSKLVDPKLDRVSLPDLPPAPA